METQSLSQSARLTRRSNGVYHYRRRVPDALAAAIGKREIHRSLGTSNLNEAKKRRAVEDIRWDARFEAAEGGTNQSSSPAPNGSGHSGLSLTDHEALRLVQDFVTRLDAEAEVTALKDPPADERERVDVCQNIEIGLGILRARGDIRGDAWIDSASHAILGEAGLPVHTASATASFAEFVRRGLVELDRRRLARAADDYSHPFFDGAFDPAKVPDTTFSELAQQYLRLTEEEATANGTSRKWIDKQKANVTLLTEIIGGNTHLRQVDYDACLRVRGVLARFPINRSKLYEGLSIDEAVAAAAAEARPLMSPATQVVYLSTLREVLELALRKRLIVVNPAEGMKPLKKDTVTASAKRLPFTLAQLREFFEGKFYRACAHHSPPWAQDATGWRFWLPLMCLLMGMRPNEACQLGVADVRRTAKGTWYLDVVATTDEDEPAASVKKSLKTASSRRRIPLHPELLAIGFLEFVGARERAGDQRLFPDLKPDSYGNCAKYALKRFRETFIPAEIGLQRRQSFYSFRHNFRDALREMGAPPDALQALGGWSQGSLVSDSYGDKSDPDYQQKFMSQVCFPGLELLHLHATTGSGF